MPKLLGADPFKEGSACIFCDGVSPAHEPACPSLVPAESLPDALTPGELDLLSRRADAFLADANPVRLEKHLTRAATMALLGLTRRALLPGGKDPSVTSLRATRELLQLANEWLDALAHRDPEPAVRPGAPAGPQATPEAPPAAKRHSRRRRV